MTRVGFVADVHLANFRAFGGPQHRGLNTRALLSLSALGSAMERAHALGCCEVHVLGDLFDDEAPPPQLIAAAQRCLAREMDTVRLLAGNHDQASCEPGDHALAPMDGHADLLRVHDEPRSVAVGPDLEVWLVPYRGGRAEEWLPAALDPLRPRLRNAKRVLALHLGLRDADTPPWLAAAPDSVPVDSWLQELCEGWGFDAVVSGHWHGRKLWQLGQTAVAQVGSLCPATFRPGDAGVEGAFGTLLVYDSGKDELSFEEVPGPRFAVARSPHEAAQLARHVVAAKCCGFVRCVGGAREEYEAALAQASPTGCPVQWEHVPDAAAAQEAAQSAAEGARASASLEQALAAFVTSMPVEDGVDRSAVLARCRRYLGL